MISQLTDERKLVVSSNIKLPILHIHIKIRSNKIITYLSPSWGIQVSKQHKERSTVK